MIIIIRFFVLFIVWKYSLLKNACYVLFPKSCYVTEVQVFYWYESIEASCEIRGWQLGNAYPKIVAHSRHELETCLKWHVAESSF